MFKTDFVKVMSALEAQYRHDQKYSKSLSQALGFEGGLMYNNSELVDCIVFYLASNFREHEKAEEKIKDFMYDFDFGRNNSIIDSPEKLYERLIEVYSLKTSESKSDKKSRKINVTELEMMLNNINNLTLIYKKVYFKDNSDSELQNIVNALDINIDFLKELTNKGYEARFDEKKFDNIINRIPSLTITLCKNRTS